MTDIEKAIENFERDDDEADFDPWYFPVKSDYPPSDGGCPCVL